MTGVAIVAIPSQDDYVWKLSSEKIPHMTLLFLGDMQVGPELAQIETFLSHVVDSSMRRFGASVDRRGTLGPKNADVLFFRKDYLNEVVTARANMLENPLIKAAYNANDQFPEWTPHLTMGYPETPAKEDTRDYPISYVQFDKIAFWIGDYEGPEFLLSEDEGMTLSMATEELAGVVLSHHGVKGMKWGVHKNYREVRDAPLSHMELTSKAGFKVTVDEVRKPIIGSAIAATIPRFRKSMEKTKSFTITVDGKKVGDASFHEENKDELNLVWLGVKPSQRGKGYASSVFEAAVEHGKQNGYKALTLEVPGNAPDAKHIYEKQGFKVSGPTDGNAKTDPIWGGLTPMSYNIQKPSKVYPHLVHSTSDDEAQLEAAIESTWPSEVLTSPSKFTPSVVHSDPVEDYAGVTLSHHGVKGMKWGVRKDNGHVGEQASTKTIAKADKHYEKGFSPSIANWVKVQNEFANHINPMLDELNSRPHYGRDLTKDRNLHDRYFKDYEKVVEKAALATTKSFGTNASGTRQMKVTRHGFGENATWKAELVDVKHAINDGVLESFIIVPKFDKTGHIIGQTIHDPAVLPFGSAVAHSEDYAGVTLSHHGVKGMKWGVRRDQNGSGHVSVRQRVGDAKAKVKQEVADRSSTDVIVRTKPGQGVRTVGGNKQDAHPDAINARTAEQKIKRSTLDSVSNKELQGLVTRMNLEQQYRNLSVHEDRLSSGEKYATDFMANFGGKTLTKLGPAAPIITKKVGDVINGNKAFDTGSATNKKK